MKSKKIICLKENLLVDNSWLSLYFDDVLFPNGTTGKYNRLVEKGGNGIVIIPIDDNKKIGMVRIYRYPIAKYSWELPRGFGENNTIENNAAREFQEEFSMTFDNYQSLGFVYPNTGISATGSNIVIVKGLKYIANPNIGEEEFIESINFFDKEEIKKMIQDGKIYDSLTLAALLIAKIKGLI